jgi:hypothetical protein
VGEKFLAILVPVNESEITDSTTPEFKIHENTPANAPEVISEAYADRVSLLFLSFKILWGSLNESTNVRMFLYNYSWSSLFVCIALIRS